MKMDYMAIFGILLLLNGNAGGRANLPGCIDGQYIDIEEDRQDPVLCDGLTQDQKVLWHVTGGHWSSQTLLGECEPSETEVTCKRTNDYVITRSATQSKLTILHNHRYFSQANIKCGLGHVDNGFSCQTKVLRSAEPAMCNVFSQKQEGVERVTVHGSCYIHKTFASDNYYTCHWQYKQPNQDTQFIPLASLFITTPYEEAGRLYYKSTCAFSSGLFTVNGTYRFFISFKPGPDLQEVGTLHIPSTAQQQLTIAKPLTFSATGTNHLTLNCGSESETDQPTWTGTKCDQGNACAFTPDPSSDEGNVITCSAYFTESNFLRETVAASFILNLNPPSAPVITGYQPGQTVYAGDTLVMTCIVRGGDPLVTSVTFYCGRFGDTTDTKNVTYVSSKVTIDPVPAFDNGLLCVCKASWPKDKQLDLSSEFTLNVEEKPTEKPTEEPTTETPTRQTEETQPGPGGDEQSTRRPLAGSRTEDDSLPVAAIGGGIAAVIVVIVVIVIVVVVIVRRRKGSRKGTEGHLDDEFVEHNNVVYEPGDSPYEVNDAYQPAPRESTIQEHPVDPTYEDHNLDSYEDGYAAVSTISSQGNGKAIQTRTRPHLDHDLYSDVDAPISKIPAAVAEPATHGNEYAVVDKSKKRNTEPTFQPDVYAQVNKSRPKTGGAVYAQVNTPAKRVNSSPMQAAAGKGVDSCAEVKKPKPDLKPKPTLKPKPSAAVKQNPKSTSGPVETSNVDDEYNALIFQERNSDTPANPDAGQLYSHIGSDI